MIDSLTKTLRMSPAILSFVIYSSLSFAQPLMSKVQYEDYSVLYQCAEINFHKDLNKKESELIRIEDKFGLTDDNFDAFDELITEYERDDSLLDNIRLRVSKECQVS
jgi:hypothetical protein